MLNISKHLLMYWTDHRQPADQTPGANGTSELS